MKENGRKALVTEETIQTMGDIMTQILAILRWSNYIGDYRFNELNKQSLNAVITYFLAIESKQAGKNVEMTKFPKIMIHRMFEKLFLCDIREDYVDKILTLGNIERKRFDELIDQDIEKQMGDTFAKFIKVKSDSTEIRMFQGATKIATKMELFEIKNLISEDKFMKALQELNEGLNSYHDIPGFSRISGDFSKEMELFIEISALRNRIRWQKRIGTVKCCVLGHNFEVAIFAYLMALIEYQNEEVATQCFFIGLFHDVPETFTGDMTSPVKDAIPGLRQAIEYFELEVVNHHIYSKMLHHIGEALHYVMLEEESQKRYKKLIKRADYFSANLECLRQIIGGSKDPYFRNVVERDLEKVEQKEPFSSALRQMAAKIL